MKTLSEISKAQCELMARNAHKDEVDFLRSAQIALIEGGGLR